MAKAQEEWRRAVIVGGGAGGLQLAIRLAKRRERDRLHVTLVDKNDTHLWKPLLHEVAAGTMYPSTDEVDYLALAHWHGFTFCHGPFEGLDRDKREVLVGAVRNADGIVIPPRRLPYDLAVLAIGSITNSFGVPVSRSTPFASTMLRKLNSFIVALCTTT